MKIVETKTRVLLLVEDNPGDADFVRELMAQGEEGYQIVHVTRLSQALAKLKSIAVDVVVLDLRLPDCAGVETVRSIRAKAAEVPIVVLTGRDDDQLAVECLDAGAQDYLTKSDIGAQSLKRAIGYAITRQREAQLRELQETLERYRALSSSAQGTTVTAALAGSGAIALRSSERFELIVREYSSLLEPYLNRTAERIEAPRHSLEYIATLLGDTNGGPRDLLDVHLTALDRARAGRDDAHTRSIVYEARLLALEMMGLLVDYYRVGLRRRFIEGIAS